VPVKVGHILPCRCRRRALRGCRFLLGQCLGLCLLVGLTLLLLLLGLLSLRPPALDRLNLGGRRLNILTLKLLQCSHSLLPLVRSTLLGSGLCPLPLRPPPLDRLNLCRRRLNILPLQILHALRRRGGRRGLLQHLQAPRAQHVGRPRAPEHARPLVRRHDAVVVLVQKRVEGADLHLSQAKIQVLDSLPEVRQRDLAVLIHVEGGEAVWDGKLVVLQAGCHHVERLLRALAHRGPRRRHPRRRHADSRQSTLLLREGKGARPVLRGEPPRPRQVGGGVEPLDLVLRGAELQPPCALDHVFEGDFTVGISVKLGKRSRLFHPLELQGPHDHRRNLLEVVAHLLLSVNVDPAALQHARRVRPLQHPHPVLLGDVPLFLPIHHAEPLPHLLLPGYEVKGSRRRPQVRLRHDTIAVGIELVVASSRRETIVRKQCRDLV